MADDTTKVTAPKTPDVVGFLEWGKKIDRYPCLLVCAPAATALPTRFQKGGVEIQGGVHAENSQTTTRRTYTQIVLGCSSPSPLRNAVGQVS